MTMKTEAISTFKKIAAPLLATLGKEKDPILLTEHGRPAAYLLGVKTFETMQRRMKILEGIACGEQAIREGRVVSHAQAKKRMKRWLA